VDDIVFAYRKAQEKKARTSNMQRHLEKQHSIFPLHSQGTSGVQKCNLALQAF
jgi:hypothetical protein